MNHEDIDWTRVGDAIADRIDDLGVTYVDMAQSAGVSDLTLRNLVKARQASYRPDILTKVSRALGWPPDGIQRVGQGEDPDDVAADVTDPAAGLAPLLADVVAALEENTAELRKLNERGGRGGRA